jgi:hypothetical protein
VLGWSHTTSQQLQRHRASCSCEISEGGVASGHTCSEADMVFFSNSHLPRLWRRLELPCCGKGIDSRGVPRSTQCGTRLHPQLCTRRRPFDSPVCTIGKFIQHKNSLCRISPCSCTRHDMFCPASRSGYVSSVHGNDQPWNLIPHPRTF